MTEQQKHPLKRIAVHHSFLTPKGRILGDYIAENPRKAVFMTTRELGAASQVSESTVVRFVSQIGYDGYAEFIQALRDFVDTDLTLMDRVDLSDIQGSDRFHQIIYEEIDNLKKLHESFDRDAADRVVNCLLNSHTIYVIGSRLSYTLAYYMGWSLTKIRSNIHILRGSDRTSVDWLTIAPSESLVVMIAMSRYPNELIRLGRLARRQGHTLCVITDSSACPLISFANETLIAPSQYLPIIGSPTTLSCLINCLIFEMAGQRGEAIKKYQERLEQSYRENDILFNPDEFGEY